MNDTVLANITLSKGLGKYTMEEVIEAAIDLPGDGIQHLGALREGHAPPRTLQRRAGGPHCGIDLSRSALRDAAEQAAIDGGALFEVPLGARGYEGIIDKMQEGGAAHQVRDITLAKVEGLMKTRHIGNSEST